MHQREMQRWILSWHDFGERWHPALAEAAASHAANPRSYVHVRSQCDCAQLKAALRSVRVRPEASAAPLLVPFAWWKEERTDHFRNPHILMRLETLANAL